MSAHSDKMRNNTKLTREDAEDIRHKYDTHPGGIKQEELADEFGVTQATVSRIIRNKCWAAPPEDEGDAEDSN